MESFALRQRPLRERFAGAAGALLLQGGFLFIFLYSMPQFTRPMPMETARELTLVFRRLPPPPAPVLPRPGRVTAPPAPAPLVQMPNAFAVPPAALPDLRDFGQALNDCAPEHYAGLPPERQARCSRLWTAAPDRAAGPDALAQDEAHWQVELAHEQSPLWLPCTFADGKIAGINFYCLGLMAAQGTLTDKDNWPVYGGN